MQDKYIIINFDAIQKKIEELEEIMQDYYKKENHMLFAVNQTKVNILEEISSQSIPLIPEIEKTWKASYDFNKVAGFDSGINLKDYINQLRLEI